jgi:hypothetical protein
MAELPPTTLRPRYYKDILWGNKVVRLDGEFSGTNFHAEWIGAMPHIWRISGVSAVNKV